MRMRIFLALIAFNMVLLGLSPIGWAAPDVAVANLAPNPPNPNSEDNVSFSFDLVNAGTSAIENSSVSISYDIYPDSQSQYFRQSYGVTVGRLEPGQSYHIVSTDHYLGAPEAGEYKIDLTVKLGGPAGLLEINLANNSAVVSFNVAQSNLPIDLIASKIELYPVLPQPGEDLVVTGFVTNQGKGRAKNPGIRIDLLRDNQKIGEHSTSISHIMSQGSAQVHAVFRALPEGNYTAILETDRENKIAEANEGNNIFSYSFKIEKLPETLPKIPVLKPKGQPKIFKK